MPEEDGVESLRKQDGAGSGVGVPEEDGAVSGRRSANL